MKKHLLKFTLFLCLLSISTRFTFAQTFYKGYAYVLSSDEYVALKYTRVFYKTENNFYTKYTIYHPTKGNAWRIVTAIHNKADKTVKVYVKDTSNSIFSEMNDESTEYETPSLKAFGFSGNVSLMAGDRVPNQLMIKFASTKYESVKVIHILGSEKSGNFNNTMYFILDEKN